MYCPSCGKSVPDESRFCLYCGSSITSPKPTPETPIEWEYDDYVVTFKPNTTKISTDNGNTARLLAWNQCQSWMLPAIQSWLDKGWQPITEVGPSGFSLRSHGGGLLGWPWFEATEFIIKMRRPKK